MTKLYIVAIAVFTVAQAQQYTTPVPILKQINKHNEDGSYSYGYEAADGTYKIETKFPNGEVFGKYGYTDDQGQLRSVEYGASRRGFEPIGNEIQVPPPTLKVNNDYAAARPLAPNEEDDGQYREDPSAYYKDDPYAKSNTRYQQPQYQQQQQPQYQQQQQPQYQQQQQPQYESRPYNPQPAYRQPQSYFSPQPQPAFRPQTNFNNFASTQNRYYNPAPPAFPNYNQFQGHPASNVDINTGSYSVNYRK